MKLKKLFCVIFCIIGWLLLITQICYLAGNKLITREISQIATLGGPLFISISCLLLLLNINSNKSPEDKRIKHSDE